MNRIDATRQLLACQQERDALAAQLASAEGTIEGNIQACKIIARQTITFEAEHRALRDQNVKLRNKILEVCKQCAECGGTGVVTVVGIRRGVNCEYQQPCADCSDLREVLEP